MDEPDGEQLIRDAVAGLRHPDHAELLAIAAHIADAGFDSNTLERARGRVAGINWQGRTMRGSDMIPPDVAHYLRHVVARQQWPVGVNLAGFLASIADVVRDERSGLLTCNYQGTEQVTIVRRSLDLRGPDGSEWILVDYRVVTGHWVTAFQPDDGLASLQSAYRTDIRWLRHPQ